MMEERWLITGFPALRARAVVRRVLEVRPDVSLVLLVHPDRKVQAEALLFALDAAASARCDVVLGNPSAIDFGLSGADYLALAGRVARIHHLYQSHSHVLDEVASRSLNVAATREVLEFARASVGLRRLVHYSTVFVSGNRTGIVLEDELARGQAFRSPAEESLALCEAMLQRVRFSVPLTIVRTGQVVGDSRTGEFERPDGPYPLLLFLAAGEDEVALPLPARADAALHVVPADFVAAAGVELGSLPDAEGQTVQLVDARPLSARRFVELAAELSGKRLVPGLAAPLTKALRGNPAVRLVASQLRSLQSLLTTPVSYDDRNALALLAKSGLSCPPLEAYLPVLIEEVQARARSGTLLDEPPNDAPHLVA
jgi:thioester reductase-like protein